jgi:hypothetical protein
VPALPHSDHSPCIVEGLTLAERDTCWELRDEPLSLRKWLASWKANLFISLVPQDKCFTAHHTYQLIRRWCDCAQTRLFGRNRKKHTACIAVVVEHSEEVGWHGHGVGVVPTDLSHLVMSQGERWLIEQAAAYASHNIPESACLWRSRSPSAKIRLIHPDEGIMIAPCYATKSWISQGKGQADRIVFSGCADSRHRAS